MRLKSKIRIAKSNPEKISGADLQCSGLRAEAERLCVGKDCNAV